MFPHFGQKVEVVQGKYRLNPGLIARQIEKDKTTAWRWLQSPHKLDDIQQKKLAEAICATLRESGVDISESVFSENSLLGFCLEIGISKLEAAALTGQSIPVPDIFVDSVFHYAPNRRGFEGPYRLFRPDKELDADQAFRCGTARISTNKNGLLSYDDLTSLGNDFRSNKGFVIVIGTGTNVFGETASADPQSAPEIFWCGLKRVADRSGKATHLYGYISDQGDRGTVFPDRIVLARVSDEEWEAARESKETHVDRATVVKVAGEAMAKYLDEWKDVPSEEPVLA